jgi:membrane protein implicated in regulation of membrane protease activity
MVEHSNGEPRFRDPFRGEAIVDEVTAFNNRWRVKFQGVYWFAKSELPMNLVPGDRVSIVGRCHLYLLIESGDRSNISNK